MKHDARFIGKDGSCNLEHGKIYPIEIVDNRDNPHARFNFRVFVYGLGIPYDTMDGITKNWKILN